MSHSSNFGVVNPWQHKSGTQCGAYGQWIGPFSHQCDGKLLHKIASQPVVEQHHQLAYVGHQLANTKGHTEIDFFSQKNSSKMYNISQAANRPTSGSVHDGITHFTSTNHHVLEEDSAQTPSWDTMCSMIQWSIPFPGRMSNIKRTSQGRRGRTKPIPRRTGHLTREVTSGTTCVGMNNLCSECFMVPGAQNFYSARGTELLLCQGHKTFIVLGAQDFLKVPRAQVSHHTTDTV